MRAQEFITELFAPGKQWQWSFTGSQEAVAVFHVGDIPYQFHAYTYAEEDPTVWEVEFKNAARGQSGRSTKFGLTGTGNSAEVMSTIADIMREFLQRYQGSISELTFTADEPSRRALYTRMAKRLLPAWEIVQSGKNFTLVAPETVNENASEPQAAGCIIVAEDTGRWCLQQRSNTVSDPGVWSTWGGGREPGETLQQTVRRELAEESGYTGPVQLELVDSRPEYATFMAVVPHEFEPYINSECQDWRWCEPDQLPKPLHPGLAQLLSQPLSENTNSYHEIEFVCANPDFCDATDPEQQQQLYQQLQNIPGVIPVYQDQSDYSAGQFSLSAIYQTAAQQRQIIAAARALGVAVDLARPVDDDYVDRAVRGELEGQIQENFADGKVKGKSRPGRVKRAGASCNGSVTDLRARAKKASGEKARMYHWCANMKSGRKK